MDKTQIISILMEYGWLIAFFVFLVAELATIGLVSVWFAVGALAAYVANLLGAGVYLQFGVFMLVSIAVMLLARPFALKVIDKHKTQTNVDSLPGRKVKVVSEINNIEGRGSVFIDGVEWTARSVDDSIIKENELVTVDHVEGVKAIVKRVKGE